MKRPNFFIIGAPKCGTTSLARWIDDHPNGFISKPKEPYFFNTDIGPRKISTLEEYEKLFKPAGASHLAIGEASTIYLQSTTATENILNYRADAKFIVMIRNPIEMVVSMHNEEIRSFNEDINDFETAWRAQIERKSGNRIPKNCIHPSVLQYYERACIGTQLKRVKDLVPENQLKIIVFDDLANNPSEVYIEVLRFLGLPYHERSVFSAENQRGVWRSATLQKGMQITGNLKRKLGIEVKTGILAPLGKWNRKPVRKEILSSKMWEELKELFKEEIWLASELCNRSFNHWLEKTN